MERLVISKLLAEPRALIIAWNDISVKNDMCNLIKLILAAINQAWTFVKQFCDEKFNTEYQVMPVLRFTKILVTKIFINIGKKISGQPNAEDFHNFCIAKLAWQ